MRLPDSQRSYAVLIGTSIYHFSEELADLPAVRRNLGALAGALTDQTLGWLLAEHCIVLSDFTDVRMVYRTLRHYAALADDTLLVYFAGHGRTGPCNELYLGLTDTDPDELRVSALPFDLIREVFSNSPAANRVLILDCCFSGRAIEDMIQDMSGPDETILGQVGIEGTYTLTSTPANGVALAPMGAHYTAFTGELITLLRTGIPDGPELLTFATVYRQLLHTMTTLGLPLPKQRGTGTVDQLALARNPARHPHQATAPPSPPADAAQQAQSVQDGLYFQNKKTPYAFYFVMFLLFGACFLYVFALPPPKFAFTDKQLDLLTVPVTMTYLGLAINLTNLAIVIFRPFNLWIGTRGIELDVAGARASYRWEEINRVTVLRPRGRALHAIYVNPAPGVGPPQNIVWAVWTLNFPRLENVRVLNFPQRKKKTGPILITPTMGFNVREIETALARFAGSRWHPAKLALGSNIHDLDVFI